MWPGDDSLHSTDSLHSFCVLHGADSVHTYQDSAHSNHIATGSKAAYFLCVGLDAQLIGVEAREGQLTTGYGQEANVGRGGVQVMGYLAQSAGYISDGLGALC